MQQSVCVLIIITLRNNPILNIIIVLRILGLGVAVVTLAYGGWTFYQIIKFLTLEGIVKVVAQGLFLLYVKNFSLHQLSTR